MITLAHPKRPAIGELDMLIDDKVRKCVAFLIVEGPDPKTGTLKKIPSGTSFFVGVPIGNAHTVIYAVTARHVIDKSRSYGPLYLRVNIVGGGFKDFEIPENSWISHSTTDVAVTQVDLSHEGLDLRPVPVTDLANDKYVDEHGIGLGDDVFFAGLFSKFAGEERNQPIIRFGNISLMPHEQIPVKLDPGSESTTLIHAYLVESKSWGGHSGSPAFIVYPPDRVQGEMVLTSENPIVLLGLVHGHYYIDQDVAFTGDIFYGSGKVPVNAGMAVVVPAQKIIDTLMLPELVEKRERLLGEIRKHGSVPRADSGIV